MSKIAGIYLITCRPPRKLPLYYVGQSINVRNRIRQHFNLLTNGVHDNEYMQRAAEKYGLSEFSAEILEICCPDDLNEIEQWWLDWIVDSDRSFNIAKCAESSKRGMRLSEKQKEQIRQRMQGENNPFSGKRHSPESLALMRESKVGSKNHWYGKSKSSEWKAEASKRLSENNITKRGIEQWKAVSVEGTCISTKVAIVFETMTDAVKSGFTGSAIRLVCLGDRQHHKGYTWRYLPKPSRA